MTTSFNTKSHSQKFRNWQGSVSEQVRFLSELVEEQIIPFFQRTGFRRVNISKGDVEQPIPSDEIELERIISDGNIDSVVVSFRNYKPNFQIYFSRRKPDPPYYEFIRAAILVRKSSQYYFSWGKPWWLPLRFWSESMARKTVERVVVKLPQIIEFLDHGTRGKNISRKV